MAFTLPDLPYAKDALAPHIDAKTMEIHHDKHHAGYTNNLNAAIEGTPLANMTIEEKVVLPPYLVVGPWGYLRSGWLGSAGTTQRKSAVRPVPSMMDWSR